MFRLLLGLAALLLFPQLSFSNGQLNDPAALYHLDEGTGSTLVDSSEHRRDGVITNGSWAESGIQGLALDYGTPRTAPMWASFPYVFPFHDPVAGGSHEASLSFWVKPVDNQHRTLFWTREGPYTDDANRYHIYSGGVFTGAPEGTSILGVDYRSPNGDLFVVFERPIQLGKWTNVVMTRHLEPASAQYIYSLYLNGEPDAKSAQAVGGLPDSTIWSLGRMDGSFDYPGWWFNGQLDEMQLWTRALTASEVAMLQPKVFSAFSPCVEVKLGPKSADDSFQVTAGFSLSVDSNGINPRNENVTLKIGAFSATIPAGLFPTYRQNKVPDKVRYSGTLDGVSMTVDIYSQRHDRYLLWAMGSGAKLEGTMLPPTINLSIGDDQGQAKLSLGNVESKTTIVHCNGRSEEDCLVNFSYFYSFGDVNGHSSLQYGGVYTVYNSPGGGPGNDTAQCSVNAAGELRAYNHDSLSGSKPGTYGPYVKSGCSEASEFGFVVRCCVLP